MPPMAEMPPPMIVATYLYAVAFKPAESAVDGLSPTALRYKPVRVFDRKRCRMTATMIAR